MSFSLAIDQFAKTVGVRHDIVLRKISFDVLASVVELSPVDTGRFRGNWTVGVGDANLNTTNTIDKEGGSTIAHGASRIERSKNAHTIVIANNLPYAKRLENGWSQQAPQGMVGVTVAKFSAFFAAAVQAARRGR